MNLVVFSDDSLQFDGEKYVSKSPETRLYAALGDVVGNIILSGPAERTNEPAKGYTDSSITYRPRPHYESVAEFFKHSSSILPQTYRNIERNVRQADLVMIRLPSPVSLLVYQQARKHDTPYFVYVVSDIQDVATRGEKYNGVITKSIVGASAAIYHYSNKLVSKEILAFTTGSALQKAFQGSAARCVNAVPSVVSKNDIHIRKNACSGNTIHLLFVGRLVPVKGVQYLLRAVKSLSEQGLDVHLRIVGSGQQQAQLEQLTTRLEISQRVTFCGYVGFGPDLLDYYRSSDIFILPSLSEGVPKTLTEAMASGIPIVATDVGGISDAVTAGETGLLITPQSPDEIHDAVTTLVARPALRKQIVENGYEFAYRHTVNAQAKRMWDEIKDFYKLQM